MNGIPSFAAIAALLIFTAPLVADEAASPGAAQLAFATLHAKSDVRLTVESPAFKSGGDIPFENTQYQGNVFPGLSWSKGPAATRSYAIIMQDPDAIPGPKHHYHLQLFALDTTLATDEGAGYAALTEAMKGHVLAAGELVGLARAP